MRITTKGQVTIPQGIRERHGFLPHTEVEFVEEEGAVVIRKAEGGNRQAREWVRRYRGSLRSGMTTDELMRLTRGDD
ncbi:MAG: AbrB/MazE/SpoVT family DNA-binding domain-containing protein [Actinomycetes bacterium]